MKVWNERLAIEIGGTFAGSNPLDQSSDGCVAYTQSSVQAKVTGQKYVYTELANFTSIGMCKFQGIPWETLQHRSMGANE